jgi:hypothetical protein
MEGEIAPHDGNNQQIFATLPLKLNGQIKIRLHTAECHSIQQSPSMKRLVEFACGAFWNMALQPDRWGRVFGKFSCWRKMEP